MDGVGSHSPPFSSARRSAVSAQFYSALDSSVRPTPTAYPCVPRSSPPATFEQVQDNFHVFFQGGALTPSPSLFPANR